jgi:energy-coupling factor transporter transmembrane protein EcfT
MQFSLDKFRNMPFSAKVGTTLWLISWIWFITLYYYLTKDNDWVLRLSIAIGILAVFLFQAQNWARWISVLANSMGLLLTVIFFFKGYLFESALNLILFSGSIYYLLIPSTATYYKSQSRPDNSSDDK